MEVLDAEREELLAEIHRCFHDVPREGGMSWREAEIVDGCGDEINADHIDSDFRWQDLLDDPDWHSDAGMGGFSFLDAIGFRYFLPAALIPKSIISHSTTRVVASIAQGHGVLSI